MHSIGAKKLWGRIAIFCIRVSLTEEWTEENKGRHFSLHISRQNWPLHQPSGPPLGLVHKAHSTRWHSGMDAVSCFYILQPYNHKMGFDADIFEMYLNGVVSAECAWISASPIQRNGTITETSATNLP